MEESGGLPERFLSRHLRRCPRTRLERRTGLPVHIDRKSTRLNSSHLVISYAGFCLQKTHRSFANPATFPHCWPQTGPWARDWCAAVWQVDAALYYRQQAIPGAARRSIFFFLITTPPPDLTLFPPPPPILS